MKSSKTYTSKKKGLSLSEYLKQEQIRLKVKELLTKR